MLATGMINCVISLVATYVGAFDQKWNIIERFPDFYLRNQTAIDAVFAPLQELQDRIEHAQRVQKWRRFCGRWKASFSEGSEAEVEFVQEGNSGHSLAPS